MDFLRTVSTSNLLVPSDIILSVVFEGYIGKGVGRPQVWLILAPWVEDLESELRCGNSPLDEVSVPY